jgi:hypothetical protein
MQASEKSNKIKLKNQTCLIEMLRAAKKSHTHTHTNPKMLLTRTKINLLLVAAR